MKDTSNTSMVDADVSASMAAESAFMADLGNVLVGQPCRIIAAKDAHRRIKDYLTSRHLLLVQENCRFAALTVASSTPAGATTPPLDMRLASQLSPRVTPAAIEAALADPRRLDRYGAAELLTLALPMEEARVSHGSSPLMATLLKAPFQSLMLQGQPLAEAAGTNTSAGGKGKAPASSPVAPAASAAPLVPVRPTDYLGTVPSAAALNTYDYLRATVVRAVLRTVAAAGVGVVLTSTALALVDGKQPHDATLPAVAAQLIQVKPSEPATCAERDRYDVAILQPEFASGLAKHVNQVSIQLQSRLCTTYYLFARSWTLQKYWALSLFNRLQDASALLQTTAALDVLGSVELLLGSEELLPPLLLNDTENRIREAERKAQGDIEEEEDDAGGLRSNVRGASKALADEHDDGGGIGGSGAGASRLARHKENWRAISGLLPQGSVVVPRLHVTVAEALRLKRSLRLTARLRSCGFDASKPVSWEDPMSHVVKSLDSASGGAKALEYWRTSVAVLDASTGATHVGYVGDALHLLLSRFEEVVSVGSVLGAVFTGASAQTPQTVRLLLPGSYMLCHLGVVRTLPSESVYLQRDSLPGLTFYPTWIAQLLAIAKLGGTSITLKHAAELLEKVAGLPLIALNLLSMLRWHCGLPAWADVQSASRFTQPPPVLAHVLDNEQHSFVRRITASLLALILSPLASPKVLHDAVAVLHRARSMLPDEEATAAAVKSVSDLLEMPAMKDPSTLPGTLPYLRAPPAEQKDKLAANTVTVKACQALNAVCSVSVTAGPVIGFGGPIGTGLMEFSFTGPANSLRSISVQANIAGSFVGSIVKPSFGDTNVAPASPAAAEAGPQPAGSISTATPHDSTAEEQQRPEADLAEARTKCALALNRAWTRFKFNRDFIPSFRIARLKQQLLPKDADCSVTCPKQEAEESSAASSAPASAAVGRAAGKATGKSKQDGGFGRRHRGKWAARNKGAAATTTNPATAHADTATHAHCKASYAAFRQYAEESVIPMIANAAIAGNRVKLYLTAIKEHRPHEPFVETLTKQMETFYQSSREAVGHLQSAIRQKRWQAVNILRVQLPAAAAEGPTTAASPLSEAMPVVNYEFGHLPAAAAREADAAVVSQLFERMKEMKELVDALSLPFLRGLLATDVHTTSQLLRRPRQVVWRAGVSEFTPADAGGASGASGAAAGAPFSAAAAAAVAAGGYEEAGEAPEGVEGEEAADDAAEDVAGLGVDVSMAGKVWTAAESLPKRAQGQGQGQG
jgi:hypothetical protein